MFRKLVLVVVLLSAVLAGCGEGEIFGPNTAIFKIVVTSRVPHNQLVMVNGYDQQEMLTPTKTSKEYIVELRTRTQPDYYYDRQCGCYRYRYSARAVVQIIDLETGIPSRPIEKTILNDQVTHFAFDRHDF